MNKKAKETDEAGCIRILHFVSSLNRGSGVMSVIMNYYRYMSRQNIQFDFVYFIACKDSYVEEIKGMGGRIYTIDKPCSSFKSVKQLCTFFQNHSDEYTWLHNHEVYLSFLLRPISKRYGLKQFIVHCHATKYSDKPFSALRNRILCLPIQFMQVERFACSEAAGIFLYGKKKLDTGKVFIMYNAIDCEKFRFQLEVRELLRKKMGLTGKFIIGHIGRFERQKNHEFLINVINEVKEQLPNCILLLIGEGSLESKIKLKVNQLKLDNKIFFLGQRKDITTLLNILDVFVMPSLYEGLPVSCIEASANGLPCIISQNITSELLKLPNINAKNIYLKDQWVNEILMLSKNLKRFNNIQLQHYDIRYQGQQLCQKYKN